MSADPYIKTRCPTPKCRREYRVKAEFVGKTVTCKGCAKQFVVGPAVVIGSAVIGSASQPHACAAPPAAQGPTHDQSPGSLDRRVLTIALSGAGVAVIGLGIWLYVATRPANSGGDPSESYATNADSRSASHPPTAVDRRPARGAAASPGPTSPSQGQQIAAAEPVQESPRDSVRRSAGAAKLIEDMRAMKEQGGGDLFSVSEALGLVEHYSKTGPSLRSVRIAAYSDHLTEALIVEHYGSPDVVQEGRVRGWIPDAAVDRDAQGKLLVYDWLNIVVTSDGKICGIGRNLTASEGVVTDVANIRPMRPAGGVSPPDRLVAAEAKSQTKRRLKKRANVARNSVKRGQEGAARPVEQETVSAESVAWRNGQWTQKLEMDLKKAPRPVRNPQPGSFCTVRVQGRGIGQIAPLPQIGA